MFDLLRFLLKSRGFEMCLSQFICIFIQLPRFSRHTRKVRPGTRNVYRWVSWDPARGTPKCLGETWDPRSPKSNPGPRTTKYSSETGDPGPQKWNLGPVTPKVKPGTSNFL